MRRAIEACTAAMLASCGSGDATGTETWSDGATDPIAPTSTPTGGPGDGGPRADLGTLDLGGSDCGLNNGDLGLSYIWIANSTEGTVSKIDSLIAANSGVYARIQRVG